MRLWLPATLTPLSLCLPLLIILLSSSEDIFYPSDIPAFKGYTARNTTHIDAFLYSDSQVDDMVEEGRIPAYFCNACQSRDISKLNFISHSASVSQLRYIFSDEVLGSCESLTILDVGSRLGAILWGAFVFARPTRVIGIEKNSFFCSLQRTVIQTFKLSRPQVEILEGDLRSFEQQVHSADVVCLHNAFDFFSSSTEELQSLWSFIARVVSKSKARLVTIPSLQEAFSRAHLTMPQGWVREINLPHASSSTQNGSDSSDDADPLSDIHLYEVR